MTVVQFPIQIGIVGAPGSGKAAVAEEFARIAGDWFVEQDSELQVVPNAGGYLEREVDQAMGVFGSHADDVRANFIRYEQEEKLRRYGASFVSVGTVIDNLAHAGVNLENILTGLQTPDMQKKMQQGQIAMSMLTFLFFEGFRYTFGFYVPHPGATVVLPGATDDGNYNKRVDGALRTIFGNFGLRIQMLDQPTIEEKAQEMFDTIKNIVENGPEPLVEVALADDEIEGEVEEEPKVIEVG